MVLVINKNKRRRTIGATHRREEAFKNDTITKRC